MINVDVSATAFNTPGPLPYSVAKILGRRSSDELRRGIPERELKKLEKFLKNIRIQVVHRGDKQLKYKVTGLTASAAERTMFRDDTGNEMSVAQYFVKQYNLGLNFPFLPCVIVRKDIFLPMEVCSILPGRRYGRKLNEAQTAEMIKFTVKSLMFVPTRLLQVYLCFNIKIILIWNILVWLSSLKWLSSRLVS